MVSLTTGVVDKNHSIDVVFRRATTARHSVSAFTLELRYGYNRTHCMTVNPEPYALTLNNPKTARKP